MARCGSSADLGRAEVDVRPAVRALDCPDKASILVAERHPAVPDVGLHRRPHFPVAAKSPRSVLRNLLSAPRSRISRMMAAWIVASGVLPLVFHAPDASRRSTISLHRMGSPACANTSAAALRPLGRAGLGALADAALPVAGAATVAGGTSGLASDSLASDLRALAGWAAVALVAVVIVGVGGDLRRREVRPVQLRHRHRRQLPEGFTAPWPNSSANADSTPISLRTTRIEPSRPADSRTPARPWPRPTCTGQTRGAGLTCAAAR